MAELYTSLVRAKMALNGGEAPPMTPLSEVARRVLDPAFTPGEGALEEDAAEGLRCPVRGCGGYFHNLGVHLTMKHGDIGGAAMVRKLLSVPKTASLASSSVRQKLSVSGSRWSEASRARMLKDKPWERTKRGTGTRRPTGTSTNLRNFRNQCMAQIGNRLVDLHATLGRSPTQEEAKASGNGDLILACINLWGSWEDAKTFWGMDSRSIAKHSRESVLSALSAFCEENGTLPYWAEDNRTPLLPPRHIILYHMKARSWPTAMMVAATALGYIGEVDFWKEIEDSRKARKIKLAEARHAA